MFQPFASLLSGQEGDPAILLPVALLIISYLIFWFVSKSVRVRDFFYRETQADTASARHITFIRIFGFLVLGVIPGVICRIFLPEYSLSDYGLAFRSETALLSLVSIIILLLLVLPATWANAGKPANLVHYPEIRAAVWTKGTVLLNVVTWAIYLAGYEFLFRGILLFPLAGHLGIWTATVINTSLYSAFHIPKGLRQAVGAIPLGLALCLLTYATGTLWISFTVHLAMALTNCFVALKNHPDMHFRKSLP
jgi:membrane protease YdiL (CAAX protease family)